VALPNRPAIAFAYFRGKWDSLREDALTPSACDARRSAPVLAPEGLNPEDLEELRASQIPKPKTIDEKLAHLWLTSPTETELSLALLAKITQRVLLISGDRDAITLEHTLKVFHALPEAELCVLPGTDHPSPPTLV
jgi:pimeloyl-ACP methyl ester carboxylesterase